VKLLGRDPTLWIGAISSLVILVGTVGLDLLNGQQAVLIVVAINALAAAANAYTVRPIAPVAFTYAIGSLIAVAGAYGFNLTMEQVAAINAGVIPLLALLSRGQVSPEETVITNP